MKKIFYLLITVAILSGCSNAPAPGSNSNASINVTNTANSTNNNSGVSPVDGSKVSSTEDAAPKGSESPVSMPTFNGEIVLTEDQKIRGEAVSKLDLVACNKLSDANTKQGCQLEIISQKLLSDPEYCKTLTDREHQNICKGLSLTILPPNS